MPRPPACLGGRSPVTFFLYESGRSELSGSTIGARIVEPAQTRRADPVSRFAPGCEIGAEYACPCTFTEWLQRWDLDQDLVGERPGRVRSPTQPPHTFCSRSSSPAIQSCRGARAFAFDELTGVRLSQPDAQAGWSHMARDARAHQMVPLNAAERTQRQDA